MRKEAFCWMEKKDVYWVLDVFSQKSTGAQTWKRPKAMGYAVSRWRLLCVRCKINGREKNVQILLWQKSPDFYWKFEKSGWHLQKSVIKSKWVIGNVCLLFHLCLLILTARARRGNIGRFICGVLPNGKDNPCSKTLVQKTLDGAVVAIWENSVIAAEKLGVCRHSLTRCARGERKSAYGYIWEYKEGAWNG